MTSTCVTRHLSLIDKDCLHPIDKAAVTVAVYTGPRSNELFALTMEDVVRDFSKITARRSITQSVTFKMPKTKKGRTVLLQPPARDALKVLVADAEKCEAADLTVWLNRHESRTDHVRVLLSPKTQTRKAVVNDYFVPSAWNTKWATLVRRAEIRARSAYQTRHTYACWNLTARGNLAFIANQMGHKDYSMLVTVYGRWIDTESSKELERIWEGMQNMAQITPKLHQKVTV
ncbi:tyrosine-type recombinase/integrase [Ottowia sp.]|uniref:tyrosine-type recombinase/integrase n=1 Tax=Ottowia sp. TaxID=1898956 RepID=UPI0025E27100|nr:tyrosine-type recombinase/integrase [Ottowia sp.]